MCGLCSCWQTQPSGGVLKNRCACPFKSRVKSVRDAILEKSPLDVEEVATPIEESVKEDSFLPQIESSHGAKNNCASIEDGIVSIKTSTVLKEDYD